MAEFAIVVNPQEMEQLRTHLARGEFIREPAREFVQRAAQKIRAEVVLRTPVGVSGHLRSRITVREFNDGLAAEVGTNTAYAPYVEFGTRPHFPPIAPIQRWVRVKGLAKGRSERSVAYMIARKIARVGTKGQFMFQKGAEASELFIRGEIQLLLQKIGIKFGGTAAAGGS